MHTFPRCDPDVGPQTGRPAAVGSSVIGNGVDGVFGSVASRRANGTAVLDAMANEGLVSTLAEPNLTAVSGNVATFLAGGEIPVPIPQALGVTSIEYKQYGVSVAFTPTVLASNRISVKVRPEVSEIDRANSVSINGGLVPAGGNAEAVRACIAAAKPLDDAPSSAPAASGNGASGTETAAPTAAATEKEINLLQQLISVLQNQTSAAGGNADTKPLISQLEQLVSSLLSGGGGDKAATVNTLLPKLEQALGQLGGGSQGNSAEASLINQVISALMGQSDGTATGSGGGTGTPSSGSGTSAGGASTSTAPDSCNPAHGVSGSEIDQMLAHANGTGAEIDCSAWDRAVNNFAATDAMQNSNKSTGSSSQSGTKPA